MSDMIFRVNAPAVVSEVIDGELVIMNLKSGKYYSSEGAGAVIWTCIEQGCGRSEIASALRDGFDGDARAMEAALDEFIAHLLAEELIRAAECDDPARLPAQRSPPAVQGRPAFVPPRLGVYSDMQDLLLLDPIHDVDERGWPTPRLDATQSPA